jgi:hypothetical protein
MTDPHPHRVVGDVDGLLVCSCGQRFGAVWAYGAHRNAAAAIPDDFPDDDERLDGPADLPETR